MAPAEEVKLHLNPFDVYFDQLATHMEDRANSYTTDTKRSKLTKHTRTERENIALDLKVLTTDEKDILQNTSAKSNVLAVYTANVTRTEDNLDSDTAKNGEKVEIKPDCGKLTDGITDAIADDVASEMYDDLIQQLGLDQEKAVGVPDHLNPFKSGYLKATPPETPTPQFWRMLRSIRDFITSPFCMCLGCSRSTEDNEEE